MARETVLTGVSSSICGTNLVKEAGVRRREALMNMAQRIDAPEVTTFVNGVIQADEQGFSVLGTLKGQAEQMR